MPNSIAQHIPVHVTNEIGAQWEGFVIFTYDDASPYLIQCQFGDTAGVPWHFSRDHLAVGMLTDFSEGPVQIYPHPVLEGTTALTLSAVNGLFFVHLATEEIEMFLADTKDLVQDGEEMSFAMPAIERYLTSFA